MLENDATGAQTEKHQKRMMGEIAKLVGENSKGTGWLDPADYERTVKILLSGRSDPVITKEPEGAWTHEIMGEGRSEPDRTRRAGAPAGYGFMRASNGGLTRAHVVTRVPDRLTLPRCCSIST